MKSFNQFLNDRIEFKETKTSFLLSELLGMLRALSWNYQTCHWQSKKYEEHLLFERLYKDLDEQIDTLAEKLVGYFKEDSVNAEDSVSRSHKWLSKWEEGNLISRSLRAEKDFQRVLKYCYDIIKENDDMHLGLDDFLMSLSSDHDTSIYLLRQYE